MSVWLLWLFELATDRMPRLILIGAVKKRMGKMDHRNSLAVSQRASNGELQLLLFDMLRNDVGII